MSTVQSMRRFVCDRMTAAAQEILGAFERKIENYEAEIARQRRLLNAVLTPEIKLHRKGWVKHFLLNPVLHFMFRCHRHGVTGHLVSRGINGTIRTWWRISS